MDRRNWMHYGDRSSRMMDDEILECRSRSLNFWSDHDYEDMYQNNSRSMNMNDLNQNASDVERSMKAHHNIDLNQSSTGLYESDMELNRCNSAGQMSQNQNEEDPVNTRRQMNQAQNIMGLTDHGQDTMKLNQQQYVMVPLNHAQNAMGVMNQVQSTMNLMDQGQNTLNLMDRGQNAMNLMDRGQNAMNLMDRGPNAMNLMDRGPNATNLMDRGPNATNRMERGQNAMNLMNQRQSAMNLMNQVQNAMNLMNHGQRTMGLMNPDDGSYTMTNLHQQALRETQLALVNTLLTRAVTGSRGSHSDSVLPLRLRRGQKRNFAARTRSDMIKRSRRDDTGHNPGREGSRISSDRRQFQEGRFVKYCTTDYNIYLNDRERQKPTGRTKGKQVYTESWKPGNEKIPGLKGASTSKKSKNIKYKNQNVHKQMIKKPMRRTQNFCHACAVECMSKSNFKKHLKGLKHRTQMGKITSLQSMKPRQQASKVKPVQQARTNSKKSQNVLNKAKIILKKDFMTCNKDVPSPLSMHRLTEDQQESTKQCAPETVLPQKVMKEEMENRVVKISDEKNGNPGQKEEGGSTHAEVKLQTLPLAFNPSVPIGQGLIIPVSGFFCKLCHKFYHNESVAMIDHCKSKDHFNKFEKFCEETKLTK